MVEFSKEIHGSNKWRLFEILKKTNITIVHNENEAELVYLYHKYDNLSRLFSISVSVTSLQKN